MNVFISIDEVNKLDQPQFVDCRHSLTEPELGRTLYEQEHLPGAIHAHLDNDLSGPMTGSNGRHPLPSLSDFHEWLQANGLTPDRKIVVYDNFQGGIAARLWWMLRQLFFEDVYIMTSGVDQWKNRDLPTETGIIKPARKEFDLSINDWKDGLYNIKDLNEIKLEIPSNYLIDSRAPERYRGEEEPYDAIAGRIPGAVNLYWNSHLDDSNQIVSKSLDESAIDTSGLSQYTVYCGSGVTAAFNLAIFEEFELSKPSIYVGSYSEWSQNYPEKTENDVVNT